MQLIPGLGAAVDGVTGAWSVVGSAWDAVAVFIVSLVVLRVTDRVL